MFEEDQLCELPLDAGMAQSPLAASSDHLADYVRAIVGAAPPLTAEQRCRIAALLSPESMSR